MASNERLLQRIMMRLIRKVEREYAALDITSSDLVQG
jgi:hypothetical protein